MDKSSSHVILDEIPEEFRVKSSDVTVYKDKHIGAGNFADVFKGTYRKKGVTKGIEVAVKVIRTGPTVSPVGKDSTPGWLQEIRNEAIIMSLFDHEHLIRLFGFSDLEMDSYCPGGSLDVYLQASKHVCAGEKVQYLKEVASGMSFLEKEKIVHRDLASRNILINNCAFLKISDFGLSRSPKVKEVPDTTHTQIPIRWMAPETVTRNPHFNNKSDMWAFGVLVYEIFTGGKKPWPNKPVKWIATQIRKYQMPHLPSSMPRFVKDIINQKCWVKADERWTFFQLHSVLSLMLCSVFTPSKVSINGYLEKKGVNSASKTREKHERWDNDIMAIDWIDSKDTPKYDLVPSRPNEGTCGLTRKAKSCKELRRSHINKGDVGRTPVFTHTTTTSQGSSEDKTNSDDGKQRKPLAENNRRSLLQRPGR